MANHLVIFWGFDAHRTFMDSARLIYRHPVVEALLVASLLLQLGTGARMALIRRVGSPRRRWQVASGVLLGLFLLVHTTSVMVGRWQGKETDIDFAAAGLHQGAAWFFAPYYVLAVAALSLHLGCALVREHSPAAGRWRVVSAAAGTLLGLLLVAAMVGAFFEVNLLPRR